jgi:hypothetical protein
MTKPRKSTPSKPPRPRELSLLADFPSPWANPRDEVDAYLAANGTWHPTNRVFDAVASTANPKGKVLTEITEVSNLGQFYQAIAFTKAGKGPEREPQTVGRVNLFSHGSPRNVALHGHIKLGPMNMVCLGVYQREDAPEDRLKSGMITAHEIEYLNDEGTFYRDRIREKLSSDAEIWLFLCGVAKGYENNDEQNQRTGKPGKYNIAKELANTFQVVVKAFEDEIWYWPHVDQKTGRFDDRTITSIGEKGERGRGYYSREKVPYLDATFGNQRRLGWHMVDKASSFSPEKVQQDRQGARKDDDTNLPPTQDRP